MLLRPDPSGPSIRRDVLAKRTNEQASELAANVDAARRASSTFRAFESARWYRSSARERALLTYSRYRTISTPVSASILFTTTTTATARRRGEAHGARTFTARARGKKKGRLLDNMHLRDERGERGERVRLKSSIYVAKRRTCEIRRARNPLLWHVKI